MIAANPDLAYANSCVVEVTGPSNGRLTIVYPSRKLAQDGINAINRLRGWRASLLVSKLTKIAA